MRKYLLDLRVIESTMLRPGYLLLRLTDTKSPLPQMAPGQFAELRVDGDPDSLLRVPISINLYDSGRNEMWLLVHLVGSGTRHLATLRPGDMLNAIMPLGNSFTLPEAREGDRRYLLVGGGVGVAPLLFLGQELMARGSQPTFLVGARTSADLVQLELLSAMGPVYVTTDDGSAGEHGLVTQHSLWTEAAYDCVYTCGPMPMMRAVAMKAAERGIPCEASLEGMMGCGLGACLCCVHDMPEGRVCVCQEGPVFSAERLGWVPKN